MKKGMLLMVIALIAALSLTAFAGTATDDVRIVNTSALDPFEYQKNLDDDDLRRLAELAVSENPELFPTIESFEVIQDESELDIHGSIDPETEDLEFISMPYTGKVGKYDVAVVMYHDQGLIPLKMIAFDRGVNITLGLPIVRTSPDHGTAYQIAGRGVADPGSMIEAIKLAVRLTASN